MRNVVPLHVITDIKANRSAVRWNELLLEIKDHTSFATCGSEANWTENSSNFLASKILIVRSEKNNLK